MKSLIFSAILAVTLAVPAMAATSQKTSPAKPSASVKKEMYSTPAYTTVTMFKSKRQCMVAQGVPVEVVSFNKKTGIALVKYRAWKNLGTPYCKNDTLYTVPVDELHRRYTEIV